MSWPLLEILEMNKQDTAAVTAPADEKSTQAENELIAERLLGWKQYKTAASIWWEPTLGKRQFFTPTFTTWHDCGLILEALFAQKGLSAIKTRVKLAQLIADIQLPDGKCKFTPSAIRDCALSYLRSLER